MAGKLTSRLAAMTPIRRCAGICAAAHRATHVATVKIGPPTALTRPLFFLLFGKFTIDAIYELCHIPRPQLPLSLKFITDTTAPQSPRLRAISRLVRFRFERRSRLNVKKLLIMLT